jgi:uncharacterized repeat protein (TIGR01451 family)
MTKRKRRGLRADAGDESYEAMNQSGERTGRIQREQLSARRGPLRPLAWLVSFFVLAAFIRGGVGGTALAAGSAGTSLTNQAAASHDNPGGGSSTTRSNPVSLAIAAAAGIAVTPDDLVASGSVAPTPGILRRFLVTNLGNQDDSFRVTALTITAPATVSGVFFDLNGDSVLEAADPPVTVGATASPLLPPGGSLGVLVSYSASGLPSGTQVVLGLSAETLQPGSANGLALDVGTIRDQVGGGALFSDPANAGQPPLKTVNGVGRTNASRGSDVLFETAFANNGTAAAANAIFTDKLPSGLSFVAGSLQLDGAPLSDAPDADAGEFSSGTVTVRIALVAPGESHIVRFRCRIDPALPSGVLLVNTAQIAADGVAAVGSSRAEVLVDPFGVLFQAGSGLSVDAGQVALFADPSATLPCPIPALPGSGAVPNLDNNNPYTTDSSGRFSFLPDPSTLGPPGSTLTCFLSAMKPGFLNRLIRIDAVASPGSTAAAPFYTLTVGAADNLPLASPGSFALTPGPVVLADVSSIGFNVPLFPAGALVLLKTADRSHAQVGEAVGYRLRLFNAGAVPIDGITVSDLLPEFTDLVESANRLITSTGIAEIDSVSSGRNVSFTVGTLSPAEAIEIAYRVRIAPGAPAGAVENLASALGTLPNGDVISAGPARAVVFIRQGIFSFQQFLIGRVFEDTNHNREFDATDEPIPGVRVVLDNGMTSTTDPEGLYSLPSVPEEAHVIGLDPVTFPPGYCPAATQRLSERGGYRLLRTPLGGGTLLKQNFILERREDCDEPSEAGKAVKPPEKAAESPAVPPTEAGGAIAQTSGSTEPEETLPPGTHVFEQKELLPPVDVGGLRILDPPDRSVAMTGGLNLTARTHRTGSIRLAVNDRLVTDAFLGQTDLDDKNQLATFHFVGVPLLAGPNRVTVDALLANGDAAAHAELTVYGRGIATTIHVIPARDSLPADGRSQSLITVELADAWGNPAQDSRVRLQTSAGGFVSEGGVAIDQDVALGTRDGKAQVPLASGLATGEAHLMATSSDLYGEALVLLLPAPRPPILMGLAEATFSASHADSGVGKDPATPERGTHGHLSFFYKGPAFPGTLLTTAYNSDQRLNRTTDTNRLFDLDPLLETYPVMGDSSLRYQDAMSNARVYLKLEKERSFLLYGDFLPDMENSKLAGYSRKLTGVNLNLEDPEGDRITLSVARPDNAFARELIPGGGISGLYRLQHAPILPGSETVAVEIHDRRNPEVVVARQLLLRGIDYDLDPLSGTLLFKRPIDTFSGSEFDLVEVVVLYEFQTLGLESLSYLGRGRKSFKGGNTLLGVSAFGENQDGGDDFRLFAADLAQKLGSGSLAMEVAHSDGIPLGLGTTTMGLGSSGSGAAVRFELSEPVRALRGNVRLTYANVDADFLNPYGATVTPGNRRLSLGSESVLGDKIKLGVAVQDEENHTNTVDNSRTTGSVKLSGMVTDQFQLAGGYDHRDYTDYISDTRTLSNLLSAGFTYTPAAKWRLSLRREQNLTSGSDPSYPNGTFLAASYQQNLDLRYFLKFRDSSQPIAAISDVAVTGLNPPRSRTELQVGAESRLGDFSTLTSRYQINSGISGTDSYAVVGLATRFPLSETLSADARAEAGVHASGPGESFESVSTGISWLPVENLRATLRYELRNMDGLGQTLVGGAVGKPSEDLTLLARLEVSDASQNGEGTTLVDWLGGLAVRPLKRDGYGVLFSWHHRDQRQGNLGPGNQVRVLTDTFSADSVFQLTEKTLFFAKGALTYSQDEPLGLPMVPTTTTLFQGRLEYRFGKYFDAAGEIRNVIQWQDSLHRNSLGLEWGIWAVQDLRIGVGYGFTQSVTLEGADESIQSGIYLNLSAKMNAILDLLRKKP